jgi:UDP-glucose:(heptosyl)LPS alpha-1,3-glucosyltransferase
MKVALVVDNFDPLAGGLEQWTVRFAEFLLARGHEVHTVTFAEGNHTLPVHLTLLPRARDAIGRAAAVAHALASLAVDVVHDTGLSWSGDVFHPQTGSRLLSQTRLVATHPPLRRLRAAISPVSILWRMRMAGLERRQIRNAKAIVVVSRLVREQLGARYGLTPDRTTLIPNGVDTARFAPDRLAASREAMRAELGAGGAVLFLSSAFNMRLKGVDTAIRALAALTAEGEDVRLVVAGESPDAEWRQLVGGLGLNQRVTFLGAVADMVPLFAASDALLHPTRWDACSLSTIEAQAAGRPAVTTAMNGASDLIVDGETGFVLREPEDLNGLAARMRLLLDPALRGRIGEAARRAAASFDVRDNHAAVERLLLEAAEQNRRSRRENMDF